MPRFFVRVRPRPEYGPAVMLAVGVDCSACGELPLFWYQPGELVYAIHTAHELARLGGCEIHQEHEDQHAEWLRLQPAAAVRDALLADAGMNLVHVQSLIEEIVEATTAGTIVRSAAVRDELNATLQLLRLRIREHDELLSLLGFTAGAMDRGEPPGLYALGSLFAPAPSPL